MINKRCKICKKKNLLNYSWLYCEGCDQIARNTSLIKARNKRKLTK